MIEIYVLYGEWGKAVLWGVFKKGTNPNLEHSVHKIQSPTKRPTS
jgi:hypothetical protein